MSKPLSKKDLITALDAQTDVIKRDISDRFDHFEKRQDKRHTEMMHGIAEVIENVNEHTTEEVTKLRADLDIRQEFNHLAGTVADRFGISVRKLTGR